MLLPLIGAGLGGYGAYQESGGNLGATLLGAGLGAVTPAGLRMAGTALGAKLAGSALASRAGAGLMGGAAELSKVAAAVPGTLRGGAAAAGAAELAKGARILSNPGLASRIVPAAAGGLAASAGLLLGAPAIAGQFAGKLAGPASSAAGKVGQVGQQGLGMVASGNPYESQFGGNLPPAVPTYDQYGNVAPSGLPADVLGLPGLGRTLEAQRQGRVTAENLQRYGDIDLAFREAAARKDFERQAAMKGIAQNIATQAAMIENSQIGAQNLGQTFGSGISQNIGRLYQYS